MNNGQTAVLAPGEAIRVTGLTKEYRLGQIGSGTLQRDLQSWWAKARGREDPNIRIGSTDKARLKGERFMALNGVDLTVKRGEALGIIGRNGAGKSTLLKILSRITAPTEGEVALRGRVTSMLEVGTGFHGDMTGRENIYMNGAILGMSRKEIDTRMADIIAFSEIGEFIDTPVKRYSSGMYVKLAFSVAAHLQSEIMIMDEVLAVGDMAFQKKCLSAMRTAAAKEGRTVLYVSHNMTTIRQLCTRCIVMDEGRIIFDGTPEAAIRVYMEDGASKTAVSADLREAERPSWLNGQPVRLKAARYPDMTSGSFPRSTTVPLRLEMDVFQDLPDISLRLEVRSDDDVPQATFIAYDICHQVHAGQSLVCEVTFSPYQLAPAVYHTLYTLFSHDGLGGQQHLDCVTGLPFEVQPDGSERLHWENDNWGYVELPQIRTVWCEDTDGNDLRQPEAPGDMPAANETADIPSAEAEAGRKPVFGFLSGTFDLFHIGHLNLIRRARAECDHLTVAVHDSGDWKGKKTFIPFEERKAILAACRYVDRVVDSPVEDTDAWELYHFDKLFVGSDYQGSERFTRYEAFFRDKGVQIIYFPYTQSTSSTQIREVIDDYLKKKDGTD